MWTVEKITNLCIEVCGKAGVEFTSPVVINNRLTSTLGRCAYLYKNGKVDPIRIEISKKLLETATDDSIKNVITHECAHYVCAAITHENHHHDEIFRFYCQQLGTKNDEPQYSDIQFIKKDEEIYKYTIYCSHCGKLVSTRMRACEVTKYPHRWLSSCCNAELTVKQNW